MRGRSTVAAVEQPVLAPVVRERWIDTAKGIAIVLVVLYHATMYLGLAGVDVPGARANPMLETFRMPLFFFMSGVLGARAVTLGYRALFQRRLALLIYLYVLWVLLQQLFLALLPPTSIEPEPSPLWNIVTLAVIPNENLWFLYALPLFFTIAWLTRSWPALIPLALAGIVSVLFSAGILETDSTWDKTGRYLFFFLLALRIGGSVRRLAPGIRWWHAAALGVVYLGLIGLTFASGIRDIPLVLFGLSLLAVAVGIALAVIMSRMRFFTVVGYLGTRTLPLYAVHAFPLLAVGAVLVATTPHIPAPAAAALPVVLGAAAIAIALGVHRLLRDVPGVFTLPGRPGRR
ncbi:acyltransferase family protein [Leifsonia sp. Leaf264]|uniref:acyltransferase family protein n=1 Tax=Leifsonia sp. Leaf264 TaxID=1736314 RepID=UPI0009E9295B|nr:acyltransferase family protein [Leifsonia sp. Leaf264]